jgi:hypothetical protein
MRHTYSRIVVWRFRRYAIIGWRLKLVGSVLAMDFRERKCECQT